MEQNPQFSATVLTLAQGSMDDTYSRNTIFTKIEESIPAEMTGAVAIECLSLIDKLIMRSHRATLEGWPKFMGVINNCIANICISNCVNIGKPSGSQYDFGQFTDQFPKLVAYVLTTPDFYFDF